MPDRPPPSRYGATLALGIVGLVMLVAVVIGFGALTTISGAVIAPGIIDVEGSTRQVQHLEGGIVAQIDVADGDHVDAGDPLLRLASTQLDASLTVIESQLVEAAARRARLEAERDDRDDVVIAVSTVRLSPAEIERVFAGQQSLFEARREARLGEADQLRRRMAQLELQIDGLEGAAAADGRQLDLINQDLDARRQLRENQLATRSEVSALERAAAELEGRIAERRAEIARIGDVIAETEIRVLQVDRAFLEQVLAELRVAEADVTRLLEQQRSIADRLRRVDIRAPVAGVVHGMAANTLDGIIAPGSTILTIVPSEGEFVVNAHVEPVDIDQVGPGQPATIRLTAFDAETTPELAGTVKTVSADRFADAATGRSWYRVLIEIPAAERARLGAVQLLPGMPAEAFIRTGNRSPLSYLVRPLTDQIQRAFRDD